MVQASSSSRRHLAGGEAPYRGPVVPLTAVGPDKIGGSGFWNWIVRFLQFWVGASSSCSFRVATHFSNSTGESTTSRTSSIKGGGGALAPKDPTPTRTTSWILPLTPWWRRIARRSKLTTPISRSSSSRVTRWRDRGPSTRTQCWSSSARPW
jgi:hypothetical protein